MLINLIEYVAIFIPNNQMFGNLTGQVLYDILPLHRTASLQFDHDILVWKNLMFWNNFGYFSSSAAMQTKPVFSMQK